MKGAISALGWRELASRMASFRAPVAGELELVDRELDRILPNGGGLIDEVSDHVLSTRGKKFRPTLLLLAAQVAGGASKEERVAASVIVELVHIATLIHDDAIDGSRVRRGKPTVNSRWNHKVSIIMGDYVYSKAFTILSELKMYRTMAVLARATHTMTVGEMAQIERKYDFDATEDDYLTVIDKKTASLIAAACEIGASIGGMGDEGARTLHAFGRQVGLAFQIMDDVLDFLGDERILGKPRGSDVRGGDVTLPLISALRRASDADRRRMRELASASDFGDGSLNELNALLEKYGGFDYARRRAAHYANAAKVLLMPLKDSPSRDALLSAADYVVQRNF